MAFIELSPRKISLDSTSKSKVKICFYPRKSTNGKDNGRSLQLRIGREVAKQIGINPGDKVSFSYDDENHRVWLIKKAKNGYTLGGKPGAVSFMIQVTWNLFIPERAEESLHFVKHDIYEGGIRIFAEIPASDLVE